MQSSGVRAAAEVDEGGGPVGLSVCGFVCARACVCACVCARTRMEGGMHTASASHVAHLRTRRRVSLDVFGHLLDLDHAFHVKRKTGTIMRVRDRGGLGSPRGRGGIVAGGWV